MAESNPVLFGALLQDPEASNSTVSHGHSLLLVCISVRAGVCDVCVCVCMFVGECDVFVCVCMCMGMCVSVSVLCRPLA